MTPDQAPTRETTDCRRRAQSEVVGVVLLVGVVAVVTLTVGVVIVGNVLSQDTNEPLVEMNVTANDSTATADDTLVLVHTGGDSFEADDASVVLRRGGERTIGLDSFTVGSGDSDSRFEPGESWYCKNWNTSALGTGPLRVLVVHEPSNAVVVDETVDVR